MSTRCHTHKHSHTPYARTEAPFIHTCFAPAYDTHALTWLWMDKQTQSDLTDPLSSL